MAQLWSLLLPTFGLEPANAYGTPVSPTGIIQCIREGSFDLGPEQTRESSGQAGYGLMTRDLLNTEVSKGSFKSMLGYRGFGWLINSARAAYSSLDMLTTGVYATSWDLQAIPNGNPFPQSYTWQGLGSDNVGMQAAGIVFDGIKIATSREKQHDVSVSMFGNALSQTLSPAGTTTPNVQTITITGTPTGGSFTINVSGIPIICAYNTTSAALQPLIRAANGNWTTTTVSGSMGGPFTVTNPAGGTISIPKIGVNYGALTGGASPTVVIAVTAPGGYVQTQDIIAEPTDISVSFSPTFAGLDSAPKATTSLFTTDIDLGAILQQVWTQTAGITNPQYVVQKKADDIKDMITVSMAYDTDSTNVVENLITFSQANVPTPMFMRVKFLGPQIATSGFYNTIQIDMACIVMWKGNKDSGGNIWSVDFDCNARYDQPSGLFSRITTINSVPDYNNSF